MEDGMKAKLVFIDSGCGDDLRCLANGSSGEGKSGCLWRNQICLRATSFEGGFFHRYSCAGIECVSISVVCY